MRLHARRNGLADLSLRPLAKEIRSSPRVLLYLFDSKEDLIRARELWRWLSDEAHRGLLRLWVESYARALIDPDGPWAGFARESVSEWLTLLAGAQPAESRDTEAALAQRTFVLAILRGAMLDLLATGDDERTTAAVHLQLDGLT